MGHNEHGNWEDDFQESIRDWLIANDVDWDRVVMWPEVVVADDGQTFQVQQFYHNKSDKLELMRGSGGGVLTTLNTYEHRVKVDPDLLASYLYSRPRALEAARRDVVERFLLHHPPAIRVHEGQKLVWVTRDRLDADQLAAMRDALAELMPGIDVSLVSGVDAVFAGPGSR